MLIIIKTVPLNFVVNTVQGIELLLILKMYLFMDGPLENKVMHTYLVITY